MFRYAIAFCSIAVATSIAWLPARQTTGAETSVAILHSANASSLERLAAKEVRRYIYLRTGTLLPIQQAQPNGSVQNAILIANAQRSIVDSQVSDPALKETLQELAAEHYIIKTIQQDDRQTLLIAGGDAVGTLYAAYRFAEHLGVRFYLHGDVVPDQQISFRLPDLDDVGRPLFRRRGIQPFHDFPEGPDWWDANAYRAVLGQLPKLRMNFFGLHTYPEGGVGPEPTVWIGRKQNVGPDGNVQASYRSRHFTTRNVTAAWGYEPRRTSDYAFGAAAMFTRDNFGADYMAGTYPWNEMDAERSNELFNEFGNLLDESFTHARNLGIKTCVGTETPLVIPEQVRERLIAAGEDPDAPDTIQQLYEGMFHRIQAAYPIDYYWLWTPEHWTWRDVSEAEIQATLEDFTAAQKAAQAVATPFQLATCGWVLGPPRNPALFDSVLPQDWPLSCINRNVGHDPVEPGFQHVEDRPTWAIPWLEDDPAMIIPQLWVGRMRKDAADALRYGCDGLLGIHWRTRILGPNVAALARAAWSQDGWKTTRVDQDPAPLTGSFEDRRTNYQPDRMAASDDFYRDWARSQFGPRAGNTAAQLFAQLDCRLPRPSTWVNGPGGITPDPRPWAQVRDEYEFVETFADLDPFVQGDGNQERFDYWLANFRYLRAIGKLNCTWSEMNREIEAMEQAEAGIEKETIARRKVLPFRRRLIRELTYVQNYLLSSISTLGGMGTVSNWQQHVFPMLLDPSEKALRAVLNEELPASAKLPRDYPADPRIFVPVVRTLLEPGESLDVDIVVLGSDATAAGFFWRPLGDQEYRTLPLKHLARGVYRAELPADQIEQDFEYFIRVQLKGAGQKTFPATAPKLNQSVVVAKIH